MKDTPELTTQVFSLYHEHIQGQRPEDVAPLTAYPPKTQTKWTGYTQALYGLFGHAPPAEQQIHGRAYPGIAPPRCDVHSMAGLYVDDGRWSCRHCEQPRMLAPTPAQRARIQAMGCRLTWEGTRAELEVSGADPRMGAALDCSPRGAVVRLWEEFITGLEKDLAAQRKGPG